LTGILFLLILPLDTEQRLLAFQEYARNGQYASKAWARDAPR
jgi:hypothetical protein